MTHFVQPYFLDVTPCLTVVDTPLRVYVICARPLTAKALVNLSIL